MSIGNPTGIHEHFWQNCMMVMKCTRNHLTIFCLAIFLWLGTYNSSFGTQPFSPLSLDPHRVRWSQLSFKAADSWVDVSSDIQLSSTAISELDDVLLKTPRGKPVQPTSAQAARVTIQTTIDHRFRSPVNIFNRIWFDSNNAAALGRIRFRRGQDDFKKVYRFTDQGVFRHRIEPANKKEAALGPEKWTDTGDTFYPYDRARLGCSAVTERSLLVYILSAVAAGRLKDPLACCVFGKRQLHHVRLRQHGQEVLDVNYIEKGPQAAVRRQGTIKALKIAIATEAMESNLDHPENFSFLGFRKDIVIYLDPAAGLPVQISGVIPGVGNAQLKLQTVGLSH